MGLVRRNHLRAFLGALAVAGACLAATVSAVLAGSGPGPFPH
ncbi:MAG TPA: hypothetical protein VEY67_06535 [Candidatus Dormibacteraeota bacterium]|nr:hypothetical protein [Candidatus Dormibacteraeota bacterium]